MILRFGPAGLLTEKTPYLYFIVQQFKFLPKTK